MAQAWRSSATARRRKTQSGQEIVELFFAFVLFMPMFLGAFVVGMNLIRSIQANQVCRDLDDMYIHGGDFSTYPMQQEAQRLAQGLNLQIGASFAGNQQSNTGNSGNGLVTVTQIMWVGNSTSTSCVAVGAANCTNESSFVFTQQMQFGNGTLANANTVSVGQCPTAILNSSGVVQNYITDARAALAGSAQTAMQGLWQTSNGSTTPLTDQQVAYIVETYFQSPDLSVGGLAGNGVYARYFF
ncbi:MAG TPA: hypothetical protein VK708_01990 [Bryobacteraceae bacterium]|jgi:hypothetical protein|nr:hypothetical protein [Bryobacteraceae bacterium]